MPPRRTGRVVDYQPAPGKPLPLKPDCADADLTNLGIQMRGYHDFCVACSRIINVSIPSHFDHSWRIILVKKNAPASTAILPEQQKLRLSLGTKQ